MQYWRLKRVIPAKAEIHLARDTQQLLPQQRTSVKLASSPRGTCASSYSFDSETAGYN